MKKERLMDSMRRHIRTRQVLIKSIATLDTSKNQKLVPIDGTRRICLHRRKDARLQRCEFAMKVCYEEQPNFTGFDEHTWCVLAAA